MRLLVLSDLHGYHLPLAQMEIAIKTADWVLLAGDITNGNINDARTIIQTIQFANPNILAIIGNMDTPQIGAFLDEQALHLHCRHRIIDGIAFAGVGGALPYYGDFVFSEPQLADMLQDSVQGLSSDVPLILLCHQPPYGTDCDRLKTGRQVGSHAVRDFILTRRPILCLTGHIHESRAIARLEDTLLINPGPLFAGYYADVELVERDIKRAELVSLKN